MMKFCALNESSLSDDDGDPELATREAQEEEAYSLYHLALRKQSDGKVDESEKMFKEILEMEFLEQVRPPEDDDEEEEEEEDIRRKMRPALTLKYLLHKNLANISSLREDFHSAVNFILEALEIDATDVLMWYQLGKAGLKIFNYSLARLAFEEGLKYNPRHWPCLDNVITVMHCLNDYANCLYYIAKGLERECYYLKGLVFKDEIYREDPSLKSFCESYFNKCDPSIHNAEYHKDEAKKIIQESLDMRAKKQSFYKPTPLPVLSLSQPIKDHTWKHLGESLIGMYDSIAKAKPCVSYNCKIDLSPYIEKRSEEGTDKISAPSPVSSLSELCSSNSVPQGGILQLATINQSENFRRNSAETNQVEMEIDDVSPANVICPLTLPPMDIQTPDQSLLNDTASGSRRSSKRKRLHTELLEFAAKRRSSRVRNPAVKKPQDNTNYQELLQKFLPAKLIGDAKCEEQDEDSDLTSLDKTSSDLSRGPCSENEKSDKSCLNFSELSCTEKEDVYQFLVKNKSNSGIIDLLYKYTVFLGEKSILIWPKSLIEVFCLAFSKLRNHITTPNLFSESVDGFRIKEVGFAMLTFCEFKVDKWHQSTGHSMSFSPKTGNSPSMFHNGSDGVGNDFHADMEFLVMLTSRKDVLQDDFVDYSARALWVKTKYHSIEGEIDLAVNCIAKLCDVLLDEENKNITVQNCCFSNIITSAKAQQQLESLQRCQSLEEVQRLYELGEYSAVIDLLILTFNQPRTKRKQSLEGVPERHAQLLLLQDSLWKLERYKECVYWSEVSFNEALQQFMNAARSDWSETMAQLLKGLDNCVKMDSTYLRDLDESRLVRLTQNLILVIVIQMENHDFSADNASLLVVLPWLILYRLILNEEKHTKSKKGAKSVIIESSSAGNSRSKLSDIGFLGELDLSSSMPSSLMLLFTAHEYLGRHSWCTTADGHLLLQSIDIMLTELQDVTGNSYLYREYLETGLEQCIYCLYGHPNKRTRAKHLQEHNAKQITLTWEKALVIFQYFKPNVLPEFDSYRTSTVSAELESLLKRITSLVPVDEDPTTKVDNYTAYIEGVTEKCPEPPFHKKNLSIMVKDLYYLLGDFYFKNKEFSKAIRFYLMDICLNPDRQDSWAGMALSRSSQLDQKLNSYELRNESTIYRKSSAALKCFEHALELDPTTTSLWIEHGSLAYILHSHASRQLKQDSVCDELGDLLRKKKLEMLCVAERCFRSANCCDDGGEPEEAWLHHYMLGKINEKKGEGPDVYLDHYQKALMYLHEDFARYPTKILYHNPAELSIEALEVYYRVHASCLKFLWKHEDKGVDLATLKAIKKCLKLIAASPFASYQEKCKKEISCSSSIHSEVEENSVQAPSPLSVTEHQKTVDHNYFDDVKTHPQKLSDNLERHQNRPSIDSSPENPDDVAVRELIDSLVGAASEKFNDEQRKEERTKDEIAQKLLIESIVEESVYTTYRFSESSEVSHVSEVEDELANERQMELDLEAETAASVLVEEMRLESNNMGIEEVDYCNNYHIYDPPRQEEEKEFFDCQEYMDTDEKNQQLLPDDIDKETEATLFNVLEKVEVDSNVTNVDIAEASNPDQVHSTVEIIKTHVTDAINESYKQESKSASDELPTILKESECLLEDHVSESFSQKENDGNTKNESDEKSNRSSPSNLDITISIDKDSENIPNNIPTNQSSNRNEMSVNESVKQMSSQITSATDENKIQKDKKDEKRDKKTSKKLTETNIIPPTPEELKLSQAEIASLIPRCLDSLRECLQRFIQHYKSLYRIAHYYCYSTKNKNLQWAREVLLAATPATRHYPAMAGLFAERKNTNFFNGIWRAPSNEIDRPGSFGAHMYRSVNLLIYVLSEQKDYNMLVFLTQQLYRTPDLGKKYMRDTDRVILVRASYDSCICLLRDQLNSLLQEEPPPEESRLICCLLEIYRSCQALIKAGVFIEETNDLLEESYTMYRMGEVDAHPSVLEQATKFCQLQLGKTFSQNPYELGKAKYGLDYDGTAFTTDTWQKELTKSFMMPVKLCEPNTRPEMKSLSEPLILIPIENNSLNPNLASTSKQTVQMQMVHVEKPKAENLKACSVAFLPVNPAFSQETHTTLPAPSLLSCQAFECFDVLKSIMQASGYKITPQSDQVVPINLVKTKAQNSSISHQQKANVGRPRKRKAPVAPRIEALDLCKRISTKPIVSSTIANSIAEIKVSGFLTFPKTPISGAVTTLSELNLNKNLTTSSEKSKKSDARHILLLSEGCSEFTRNQISVLRKSESLKIQCAEVLDGLLKTVSNCVNQDLTFQNTEVHPVRECIESLLKEIEVKTENSNDDLYLPQSLKERKAENLRKKSVIVKIKIIHEKNEDGKFISKKPRLEIDRTDENLKYENELIDSKSIACEVNPEKFFVSELKYYSKSVIENENLKDHNDIDKNCSNKTESDATKKDEREMNTDFSETDNPEDVNIIESSKHIEPCKYFLKTEKSEIFDKSTGENNQLVDVEFLSENSSDKISTHLKINETEKNTPEEIKNAENTRKSFDEKLLIRKSDADDIKENVCDDGDDSDTLDADIREEYKVYGDEGQEEIDESLNVKSFENQLNLIEVKGETSNEEKHVSK